MTDLPSSDDASQDEFYLGDVAIDPPLEEFRRTFEKKIRSFEGDGGEDRREPYTRAFELGEAMIQRKLGEAESC
ncbi:MAG: hypothetical protein AAF488_10830 [Planctomycetota bacterium]